MKQLAIIILSVTTIYSCSKQENPSHSLLNGMYTGSFEFENTSYWYSIAFNEGRYEEWPSGGAFHQKSMGCLSVGSYLIIDDQLIFKIDSLKFEGFPEPCKQIMLLTGTYNINLHAEGDSIVFERMVNDETIVYHLKIQD